MHFEVRKCVLCRSGFDSKRGWRSSVCQSVRLLHADDRHAVHFKSRYILSQCSISGQSDFWALNVVNVSLLVFSVPLSAFGVSHEIQAGSMEGMDCFFVFFEISPKALPTDSLIAVFLKDLLYVISYGPSQVKPPAVQMLFHYWPNLKPPGAISEYRGLQYTGETLLHSHRPVELFSVKQFRTMLSLC